MSFADALAADQAGDLEEAAAAYEDILVREGPNVRVLLNLVLLYWQSTDFGLSSAKQLTPTFVARAGQRVPTLLAEANRAFPKSTEVQFWKRYIQWADLGEEFAVDECRELLLREPKVLVPVLHLFAQSRGLEHEQEALALLRQCEQEPTTTTEGTDRLIV